MNVKEKLKSKVNVFGKQVPAFLIALVLMASIGFAALLSSYGTVTGTADVSPGVTVVDGGVFNLMGYTNSIYASPAFTVTDIGNLPVDVSFTTDVIGDGDCAGYEDDSIAQKKVCSADGLDAGSPIALSGCPAISISTMAPSIGQSYVMVIEFSSEACIGDYTMTTDVAPV